MSNQLYIKDIAKVTNGKSDVKDAVINGQYVFFDRSVLYKKSNKYLFDTEAIIIPGEDSREIFEPRYFKGKFDLHQRCYVIYDFEKNYAPKYLFYKLKTLTKHFANVFVGSTVPSLRLDHITDLKINFPSFSDQQKIASVLSAIDAKIELNHKINVELEEMAKTLYDYWFVQFDFPDGNGKPYKTSGGKMVFNEELKREIPEGWHTKLLKDISEIIMGQSPKGSSYNENQNGIPLLNGPADYENGSLVGRIFTTEPTRLCKKNDFVFCVRATIGNLTFAEKEFCLGRGVAAVRVKDNKISEFAYYALLQEIERFKIQAGGSIIVGITKDDLIDSIILQPDENLVAKFHDIAYPIFNNIRLNKLQNLELSELRDWLLPMLMNGQVSVK